MSHVYPQSIYGQPSYGVPVPGFSAQRATPASYQQHYFQPPPPPQPQQQAAPPQPLFHSDPNSFRRDFTSRLSNLTINSRVHIQDLSMMAQDHPHFSSIVAQSLDHHIRQVPPWMKLPGFYLLDAISKNVFEPYASVFSRIVTSLFMDAYFQVDSSTRNKMEEMLLTWRTAGPEHSPLFGPETQDRLQTSVWGDQSFATKNQVLSELQFTLGQMERALQANPRDRTPEGHIHVLNQLRRLVERGVSQPELRQILEQLRTLARSALPPPVVRPPPPTPRPVAAPYYNQHPPFPPQAHAPPPRPYSHPPPLSFNSIPQAVDVAPPQAPVPALLPSNLESLMASLVKSGVLSVPGTSTPTAQGTSTPEVAPPLALSEREDPSAVKDMNTREYRNFILSEPIALTTSDITRARPRIVELLYERQTSQCKQCGIRFADTKLGKKRLEDHLDMHFRQNSKVDQGRGHSRSWFTSLENWIHDASINEKGKGPAHSLSLTSTKVDNAKREEELRAQFVVIPPGAEAQSVSCPICKETLQSEFLEDEEEWVWRNAVKKDDKIYHATCHAEATTSTSSIAARLRTEKQQGSRSATPEVYPMTGIQSTTLRSTPPPSLLRKSGSRSPPQLISPGSKVAGVKRKVDHHDSDPLEDGTGTPPFKKLALSSTPIPSS
ncbi:hypothetical protein CPB83DRAFT_843868 [Crepidotus variabilis]|uniref:CID domain-containing protein n=1 Tax=Crepidotus variabilis TaxID=179855 RepID=A0A9P6JUF7_9AGAR|nr:hypothetical protein CPB83DRAFT_843868 [Crepidotus variabilis]